MILAIFENSDDDEFFDDEDEKICDVENCDSNEDDHDCDFNEDCDDEDFNLPSLNIVKHHHEDNKTNADEYSNITDL